MKVGDLIKWNDSILVVHRVTRRRVGVENLTTTIGFNLGRKEAESLRMSDEEVMIWKLSN